MRESARVQLATGTTLQYQPIIYDGVHNPAAPAGNDTAVLAFRLESVTDSNGFRSCFTYQDFNDTKFGKIGVLKEIDYGPTPITGGCASPAFHSVHSIVFDYADMEQAGYFAAWTLRFGAPVKFGSLLKKVTVIAAGKKQDEFALVHEGTTTETRQPRLVRIEHAVQDASGKPKTRVERTYRYGERKAQFDGGSIVELPDNLRDLHTFPDSIAGTVTRPMLRQDVIDNPLGAGQIGQDTGGFAPVTTATTEQWALTDINGDGLPDFLWSKEKGADPTVPEWSTFGVGLDKSPQSSDRPAQQAVILNEGIAGGRLATTTQFINFRAPSLETRYIPGAPDPDATPVSPPVDGFSPWFWADGNGMTRTGMPVSVSAGEISNPAPACPLGDGQDSRLWPRYPDGMDNRTSNSLGAFLAQPDLIPAGVIDYLGNPVLQVIESINHGYHPNYGISSTLSGWIDLDGDGIKEFVATPSMIERFTMEPGCHPISPSANLTAGPGQRGARQTFPAVTGNKAQGYRVDTDWYRAGFDSPNRTGAPCPQGQICLDQVPGPPGLMGLPLSYETSTVAPESAGFTVPVGSLIKTLASYAVSGSWITLAAAGPGHVMDSAAPRSATGYNLSVRTPSATGLMQAVGNKVKDYVQSEALPSHASGNSDAASSIAGLIISLIPVDFDLTLVSVKNTARSETQAHLMDVNGDGFPDYVLYNGGSPATRNEFLSRLSGTQTASDPMSGVTPGDLVVFFNSPTGAFGPPKVINRGMSYVMTPPDLNALEGSLSDARLLIEPFNNPLLPVDKACYGGFLACVPFSGLLWGLTSKADDIIKNVKPLMTATADATPRERSLINEVGTLNDTLKGMAAALPLQPVNSNLHAEVDTTTAAARALVEDLGYLIRTVRQIGHSSRVNIVSQGFSELDGTGIGSTAGGISVQTRGFVDLNGDGLPDYVITNDREPVCAAGQWEVFWGTGTSSISAQRAFLPTPSCIAVPSVPTDIATKGFPTLPLNVDRVLRAATGAAQSIDTVVHSHVSLVDFNHDGRPDLLIAGTEPWDATATARSWKIFLNTGAAFELTPALTVSSPSSSLTNIEPASPAVSSLAVPYPMMGTTRAASNPGATRSSSATHTAFVDIDGDGVDDIVRRVRRTLDDGAKREALLVWRRPESGPQDLMIDERLPLEGHRTLIDYRPAPAFQWTDGEPNGLAPQLGHQPVTGIRARLVRSVTTEPQMGRPIGWSRRGYDYKLPFFDMKTRTQAGFAIRRSMSLDPVTGRPIAASVETTLRSAQRPDLVSSITNTRLAVRGSGAPVRESLVSYSEVTTATGGIGGLKAVFGAPSRRFEVEYPEGLTAGAVFEVGFDGRKPFEDRARSAVPTVANQPELRPAAATGGAAAFASAIPTPLTYPSPYATALSAFTIEAWIRKTGGTADRTLVHQPGAYRLFVRFANGEDRAQLEVGGTTITATLPLTDRWTHIVATVGAGTARLYLNGVDAGSGAAPTGLMPNGPLVVGCRQTGTAYDTCFEGEVGELRLYPQMWPHAPRVTDTETEYSLTPQAHDFGQALRVLERHDLATSDDDIVTEYQYAQPVGAGTIRGAVAQAAVRVLAPDGKTSGNYLNFSQTGYDGLPIGQIGEGNVTSSAQFAGPAETAVAPTKLDVITRTEYTNPLCPGKQTKIIDPEGGLTTTKWNDSTCAFVVSSTNALGHVISHAYYGVNAAAWSSPRGPFGILEPKGTYGQLAESIDANGAVTRQGYDEWGRLTTKFSPLDRADRPGLRFEYTDARCYNVSDPGELCNAPSSSALFSPFLTTTYTWDDAIERYRRTYEFGDGQLQTETLESGKPGWTISGARDFDTQGRVVRSYKMRYLPAAANISYDPCPAAGNWCDVRGTHDPLRVSIPTVLTAYDTQSRVIRTYGPGVICSFDPSAVDKNGQLRCDAEVPTGSQGHVTRIDYLAPGVVRTTDARGVATVNRSDTRGLVTRVEEYKRASSTPYSTVTFSYDRLGRKLTTTDQAGNVAGVRYDALSRVLATDDPDAGAAMFAYDRKSQLLERIAATGDKTTNTYDLLGRVTKTDYLRPKPDLKAIACCGLPGSNINRVSPPNSWTIVNGVMRLNAMTAAHAELAVTGSTTKGDLLQIKYRWFSRCANQPIEGCSVDRMMISYRDPERPASILPLLDWKALRNGRYLHSSGLSGLWADVPTLNIPLPDRLLGRQFTLVFDYDPIHAPDIPALWEINLVQIATTTYTIEERVLRNYDSSEPDYYVRTNAAQERSEARPLLDLTFDVPGWQPSFADCRPSGPAGICEGPLTDRSPTLTGAIPSSQALEAVSGASGFGARVPAGRVIELTKLARVKLINFTAEAWIRRSDVQATQIVFSSDAIFALAVNTDGKIECTLTNKNILTNAYTTTTIISNDVLPTDVWAHVALVRDGDEARCYINGVFQRAAKIPRPAPFAPMTRTTLGDSSNTASVDVDEVRLIAESRTESEILEDALRPLRAGPPRGDVIEIGFGNPSQPEADVSTAGNHGHRTGGELVPGIQGRALHTLGSAQIEVAHSPSLHIPDAVTSEAWVKLEPSASGPALILGKWASAASPGWRLGLEPRSRRLRWETVTRITSPSGVKLAHVVFVTFESLDNAWHHVAGTYDGSRLRVFIDGVPAHRTCSPGEPGTGPDPCTDPPRPEKCSAETVNFGDPPATKTYGDAVCTEGTIENTELVLAARDGQGTLDGYLDELRVSNYAKREFEMAASSRVAAAFTQTLGREVELRNQLLFVPEIESQVADERRAFDARGRLVSAWKHVHGQRASGNFVDRIALDNLDRVGAEEYPTGEVLASEYDLALTQRSLTGYGPFLGGPLSGKQTYVSAAASTVTGRIASLTFGNGVTSAYAYEDGNLGVELLSAQAIGKTGALPLSQRTYTWDAVGNLMSATDPPQNYTATYTPDDLNRLKTAAFDVAGQNVNYTYDYDPLGNLTSKEGVTQDYGHSFSPACGAGLTSLPHAVTRRIANQAVVGSLCYDEAGRVVRGTDVTLNSIRDVSYYARGKVSYIVTSQAGRNGKYSFSYDGNGMRVAKTESIGATIEPYPHYREIPGGDESLYSTNERLVARRAGDVYWLHLDHLGGTNLITDVNGKEDLPARTHYRPFGETLPAGAPQNDHAGGRLFTGKELDATGLYDFGARPYDPITGRFLQPDDVEVGLGAQAQNRFSYVLNNPLAMIDPSGHQEETAADRDLIEIRERLELKLQARLPLRKRAELGLDPLTPPNFPNPIDEPPALLNYIPGFRAGWLLGEAASGETISGIPVDRAAKLLDAAESFTTDALKVELMAGGMGMLGTSAGRLTSLWRIEEAQATWWTDQMVLRGRLDSADRWVNVEEKAAGHALRKHSLNSRAGSSFPPIAGNPDVINLQGQEILGQILTSKNKIMFTEPSGVTTIYDTATGRGVLFDANGRFVGFRDMAHPQFRVRADSRAP
jgi:RHS repeat-associated protein